MNQVLKVKGGRADAEDPRMLISARPPPGQAESRRRGGLGGHSAHPHSDVQRRRLLS